MSESSKDPRMASAATSLVGVLPLRGSVLFPHSVVPFFVGRAKSISLLRSLKPGDLVLTVTQNDSKVADPQASDLTVFGTCARVKDIERRGEREYQVLLEGLGRVRVEQFDFSGAFIQASFSPLTEEDVEGHETRELALALQEELSTLGKEAEALSRVTSVADAAPVFADRVAANVALTPEQAVALISETNATVRLRSLIDHVRAAKVKAELRTKIDHDVRSELGKHQREMILREQLRAIQKELGDGDESDADRLRKRLEEAKLPADVRKVAERELRRLDGMNGQGPEANVIRNYLDLIVDLPWEERAIVKDDIEAIEARLDADHHGLSDIKKRIVQHMAVLKLAQARAAKASSDQETGAKSEKVTTEKGTLLCLVGPPGVGKTSLGQSVADATGRPFVRIALGGVRDEAEVRGHRRTYVGALPGRVISALRKVKVKNPVILLDEIDKLGSGWQGSPEAALLELLDPEQNRTFTDHYLELPFDLSEALFICTANTLETLSAPLRDRLEIVELSGYTTEEKVHIAQTHLVPKRLAALGLSSADIEFDVSTLEALVRDYTRESGVRQLDREIGRICRGLALEVAKRQDASDEKTAFTVKPSDLRTHLGKPKFDDDVSERTSVPGVATGLAWTPVGGSILFIETSRMPGRGKIEITGQLGDVMKESARAALTYVRSNAAGLGIPENVLENQDVHIHVPAGSTPKDGPSAGVTIFTALTSLFTGRRIRSDTAMTGEATLRGRVLPVGGIKGKVLAAHRAGIKRVILPKKCMDDLDEVPAKVKAEMEFFPVTDMGEVLEIALEDAAVVGSAAAPPASMHLHS
ncbi:MAG: endopeptidase La [Polyangiaceae bacterium]